MVEVAAALTAIFVRIAVWLTVTAGARVAAGLADGPVRVCREIAVAARALGVEDALLALTLTAVPGVAPRITAVGGLKYAQDVPPVVAAKVVLGADALGDGRIFAAAVVVHGTAITLAGAAGRGRASAGIDTDPVLTHEGVKTGAVGEAGAALVPLNAIAVAISISNPVAIATV